MDYAANEAPLNSEMCTDSRGSILPQGGRGSLIGKHANEGVPGMPTGLESRNAFPLSETMYGDNEGDPTLHLTEGRA
jgi:hypothetical protein